MKRTVTLWILALTLSACSFETQLEALTFECSTELPCGAGFVCDLSAGTCIAQGTEALPEICLESACSEEQALQCSPDGLEIQRCARNPVAGCLVWSFEETCNDDLDCTTDVCSPTTFTCASSLNEDRCLIDGVCRSAGVKDVEGCRFCEPLTRTDAWVALPNGASCQDSYACTVADTCQEGFCIGGDAPDCDDDVVCTTDSCVEDEDQGYGCEHDLASGNCLMDSGAGPECLAAGAASPDNPCMGCNPSESTEVYTANVKGTPCEDGNICTTGDTCDAGVCVGPGSLGCDDKLSCTLDTCDPGVAGGCVNAIETGACVIANQCWAQGDTKPGGDLCLGCFPEEGELAWTAADNGASCDDGDLCSVSEVCNGGLCEPGLPKDCSDGLSCTTDVCNVTTGGCESALDSGACLIDGACELAGVLDVVGGCNTCDPSQSIDAWVPLVEQTSCSDKNPCTISDTCSEGVCLAGTSKDCSDGLSCTLDTCEPTTGACQSALDGGHCEIDGACVAAGALSPDNPCLACQPEKAESAYTLRESGSPCDDEDVCTVNDACDGSGTCSGGQAAVCDDGLSCTTDACVSEGDAGCVSTLSGGKCLIETGGEATCYSSGETSVEGGCLSCAPVFSTDSWTEAACFDGLGCTTDACSAETGSCENALAQDTCLIGGACYSIGDTKADNPCIRCDPEYATDTWYPSSGGVCDDYANGEAVCLNAKCEYSCNAPWANCDAQNDNGCEVNTDVALYHCGTCGKLCTGGLACVNGACSADCGALTKCGPYCADLSTSTSHCGGCDNACEYDNATVVCDLGGCDLGACDPGYGNPNGDKSDGCECMMTGPELCDGVDNDCDGEVDNVSEDLLTGDPENCGTCGEVCPASDQTYVGVCDTFICAESYCPVGSWNLNAAPGDGCEYECAFTGADELCDGADQNCDGQIDEGFDLLGDLQNCGFCGHVCAADGLPPGQPDAVAAFSCVAGVCLVAQCEPGWKDLNHDASDGCEHPYVPDGTLRVHWLEGNDLAADGSKVAPYATIQAAIDAAPGPDWVIEVAAGIYDKVVIGEDQPGLTLTGAGDGTDGGEATVINAPDFGVGVEVRAHDTTVSDLKLVGGQYGVFAHNLSVADTNCCVSGTDENQYNPKHRGGCDVGPVEAVVLGLGSCPLSQWNINCIIFVDSQTPFTCGELGPLTGLSLERISAEGQEGPVGLHEYDPGGEAAGVHLLHAQSASLSQLTLSGATGGGGYDGTGSDGSDGGLGLGLILRASHDAQVVGLSVTQPTGGVSGRGGLYWLSVGGAAAGLLTEASNDLLAQGISVVSPTGGAGGEAAGSSYSPGIGGQASGLLIKGGSGGVITGLEVTGATGGAGGPHSGKRGQVGGSASGVALEGGAEGYQFTGTIHELTGGAHSTDGTPQVTYGVHMEAGSLHNDLLGLTYGGASIRTIVGETGTTHPGLSLTAVRNSTNWGKLLVADSSDITLSNLMLSGARGARGRTGTNYDSHAGTSGGDAVGLHLVGCTGCLITGLEVSDLLAGDGGESGEYNPAGTGGKAMGVVLSGGTSGTTLTDSSITGLTAGAPGAKTYPSAPAVPDLQAVFGLWLEEDSLENTLTETVLVDGDPVIYRHGASDETLSGLSLTSPVSMTNWGEVVIFESENIILENLVIHGARGAQGASGNTWDNAGNYPPPTAGTDGVGVRLQGCAGCVVRGVQISGVTGGAGGAARHEAAPAGAGVGLHGLGCEDLALGGLLLSHITGGAGGGTSTGNLDSSAGAPGLGVRLAPGPSGEPMTCAISHLTLAHVQGGAGGLKTNTNQVAEPGEAHGLQVAQLGAGDSVTLTHAIVSGVQGTCLVSDELNPLSKLQVTHTNLHACGPEGSDGTNYQKNAVLLSGMMFVDPLFMDPNNGNYHLSSGSPLIDAGLSGMDACLDYELEPEPNGCATNLGYYGGTSEAATKAGADHCVCPVGE